MKNNTVNAKRNYLYNVLCELVTTLIPLITTPYVTRMLDRDGMGSYNYVMTIASYFVLFAGFGIKAYGNRCIAASRDDKNARNRTFSSIFYLQLCLSLFVGALYACYVTAFGGEYRILFAVFGINLLSAAMDVTWLYYGMERFAPIALFTVGIKLGAAVCTFLFVRGHDDLWIYALIASLGVILVQVLLWGGVFSFVRFVRVPPAEIKKHFLPCAALLLPLLAPTLYRSMDKLMLEGITGKNAVGLYGAVEQLQTCMLGFITSLGVVMLPRVSHLLARGNERDARAAVGKSMQFSVFLGCAFSFGIAAVSDIFVPYYYGSSFAESAVSTALLAPTILFISFAEVIRSQYIIPHKRDRIFVVSVCSGAIVNLLCNAVCIPLFYKNTEIFMLSADAAGTLGAIPGTLLAELTVLLVQYLFLRKELPFAAYLRECAVFVCAGVCMLLAVRGCRALLLSLGIVSPLGLLCATVALGGLVYLSICGGWYALFRRDALKELLGK